MESALEYTLKSMWEGLTAPADEPLPSSTMLNAFQMIREVITFVILPLLLQAGTSSSRDILDHVNMACFLCLRRAVKADLRSRTLYEVDDKFLSSESERRTKELEIMSRIQAEWAAVGGQRYQVTISEFMDLFLDVARVTEDARASVRRRAEAFVLATTLGHRQMQLPKASVIAGVAVFGALRETTLASGLPLATVRQVMAVVLAIPISTLDTHVAESEVALADSMFRPGDERLKDNPWT